MRKAIWAGTGIVALAAMLASPVYAGSKKHAAAADGSAPAAQGDAKAPKSGKKHAHKKHKAAKDGATDAGGMK